MSASKKQAELGQEALALMALIVAISAALWGSNGIFLLALAVGLWFGGFAMCRRFALRSAADEITHASRR
jgi:hypothetical protein